jgi:phospholipase/carboxylesterase
VFRRREDSDDSPAAYGRLVARPAEGSSRSRGGLRPLGLGEERDGLLYVPEGHAPGRRWPLVVMLHGAGGTARRSVDRLLPLADELGLLLLVPESRDRTWDVLVGGYGPDVRFIDAALERVFADYTVDPSKLAVEGFSDGASYGLSIGIANGDLFTHILAFSPGFMAPPSQEGAPRIFVSHGVRDQVLPIDYCSRRLVPQLRAAGYDVRYDEFDGPHTVPPEIARAGVEWFLAADE